MALIECPNCSKQISDKANVCPSCGYTNENSEDKKNLCIECGTEISMGDNACPSCGCPIEERVIDEGPQKVEVTSVNLPKLNKKKKNIIIISSIFVLLIVIGSVIGINIRNQNTAKRYEDNLYKVSSTMLTGAASAENAGGLIHDVWYNTIYKKSDSKTDKYTKSTYSFNDDFNNSLQTLFADSSFGSTIESIKSNQKSVDLIMKELVNPPDQFNEAYIALKKYYDAYLKLTNLVTNPTGSLQTFTSNFNDADSETSNCYKAMQMYIK